MANDANSNNGKRLWVIIGGIVVIVALLAAFITRTHSATPVRVAAVTRGPISSVISTNGKIEPLNAFQAHAAAPATVREIYVKPGDHVKPGQLLVQLDAAEARAETAKAQAQVKAAEADVAAIKNGGTREEVLTNQAQLSKARTERDAARRSLNALRALEQKGAASPDEVRAAQNKLNAAEADLRLFSEKKTSRFSAADLARAEAQAKQARAALSAAQDLLNRSEIRSPREGEVYALPVRTGEYVNTGDLVVAVANLSTVQVRAFVDEPDIGRLKKGAAVEVTWDAIPDRVWKGTLNMLPTSVTNRGTRNVGEITCSIENQDRRLLPNINVSVNVVTAKDENALTIPREALHQDQSGRYVFQVSNGELKRIPVETSISNLTRIEVTKGLADNAVVALGTSSSQQLKDGLQVRAVAQ